MNLAKNKWREVSIPEVLFFQEGPGVRKWQFTKSGVKLLNVGNINNGRLNLSTTSIYVSEDEANGKYAHFLVDPGDLLIACSGIVVNNFHNKIAYAREEHLPLCMNTSTMRFKPLNGEVKLDFFKYVLQSRIFTSQLRRLITGSAQLNFGPSHIKKIKIPLPPVPIQQQIAEILDTADALHQKTQAQLDALDELTKSVFFELFGDLVENEKGWNKSRLDEISHVVSGVTKGRRLEGKTLVEVPYMRVANVQDGFIDLSEIKNISVLESDIEKYRLQFGDILLTEGGDPDKLGRGAVWKYEIENCIHQNHIFRVRPNVELVNSVYLSAMIGSSYGKRYFLKAAKQTTGIATINSTQLKRFPAMLPPVHLQNQFAIIIDNIEEQKSQFKKSLKESEDLFNALLQEIFQ